jgi:hypothetical protein
MLNYTEKTQNTYIRSVTVWEIMAIENCGLPSGPRSIAVSWDLSGGRANDAAFPPRSYSSRCGFLGSI